MLEFIGYNFTLDENCLDENPNNMNPITNVEIKNGIFDHFNLTRDIKNDYSDSPPLMWQYLTIMNANFNGNIQAGNMDFTGINITSMKVKRRKKGDFEWATLKIIQINGVDDLTFAVVDNLAIQNTEYEYAFVPVVSDIEGDYIVNEVLSSFNGVFICDANTIYKFYAGVKYGANERVQKVGVFEPYGKQYPIVVSNGLINYERGSVGGNILPKNYLENRNLNREEIVLEKNSLLDFITTKKGKILKDWNGNAWLMFVVGSPSINYVNEFGMGMMDINMEYSEIGNYNSNKDLFNAGLTAMVN